MHPDFLRNTWHASLTPLNFWAILGLSLDRWFLVFWGSGTLPGKYAYVHTCQVQRPFLWILVLWRQIVALGTTDAGVPCSDLPLGRKALFTLGAWRGDSPGCQPPGGSPRFQDNHRT